MTDCLLSQASRRVLALRADFSILHADRLGKPLCRNGSEKKARRMAQETFSTLDGPLELMPGDGQCRAANLAGHANVARNFGRDARGIVERLGYGEQTSFGRAFKR